MVLVTLEDITRSAPGETLPIKGYIERLPHLDEKLTVYGTPDRKGFAYTTAPAICIMSVQMGVDIHPHFYFETMAAKYRIVLPYHKLVSMEEWELRNFLGY